MKNSHQGLVTSLVLLTAVSATGEEPVHRFTGALMERPSAASTSSPPVCGVPEGYDFQYLTGVDFGYSDHADDGRANLAAANGEIFWSGGGNVAIWKADFEVRRVSPLALRFDPPQRVLVTDDAIFWISSLSGIIPGSCTGTGVKRRIFRAALDGSNATLLGEFVNCGHELPLLVADETHLYFLSSDVSPPRTFIRKIHQLAGQGSVLVDQGVGGGHIYGLAQDETYLYWKEGPSATSVWSRLRRVPKVGGSPETLLDGFSGAGNEILIEGEEIVLGTGSTTDLTVSLVKVPKGGGAPTTLAVVPYSGFSRSIHGLASDGTRVYWIDSGSLNSVPLSGGVWGPLATIDEPVGLTVNAGFVFWSETPFGNSHRSAIRKIPVGGGPVTTVAEGLQATGPVVSSGNDVYWTEPYRIGSVPATGSEVTAVVSGVPGDYARLATDGVNVYFSTKTAAAILKVPVDGGPVESLSPSESLTWEIVTDGENVYWVNAFGAVWQVPVTGGPSLPLGTGNIPGGAVSVGGGNVFWLSSVSTWPNTIRQVPVDGGPTTTLVDGYSAIDLIADDSAVYFIAWDPFTSAMRRVDPGGGPSTQLSRAPVTMSTRIAQNADNLYWVAGSFVSGLSKEGGPRVDVSLLSEARNFPDDIAVDGSDVYFTNVTNRRIVRAIPREYSSRFSFGTSTSKVSESSKLATITVRRRGSFLKPATVQYATVDGNAADGADYRSVSGTLSFPRSVATRSFTVPILDDRDPEGPETILLRLGPTEGCATVDVQGTSLITIEDNEAVPQFQFSASKYSIGESRGSLSVTVRRVGRPASPVTVDYFTGDGSATAGLDYSDTQGTLAFGAGIVSRSFLVPILDDGFADPGETLTLTLRGTQAAVGTPSAIDTAIVAITDNDQALQFTAPIYFTAETSPKAIVSVKRVGGSTGTVSVDYAATGGAATNGADYTLASGTLTFAPGQMMKSFAVGIRNDAEVEGSETIELTLRNPSGATVVGNNPGVLTIADSEPVFQFLVPQSAVAESAPGKAIVVKRTGPLARPAFVSYELRGGTAVPGADYLANPTGTLTFAAGVSMQSFIVDPIDDGVDESDEEIILALRDPSAGYGIGTPGTASMRIRDKDEAGVAQFNAKSYTVTEDRESVTITVVRTGSSTDATVSYASSDGTAVAGENYIATSGTLHFAKNERSKTFTVAVLNDRVSGPGRFLKLSLSSPSGGLELGAETASAVWILDAP